VSTLDRRAFCAALASAILIPATASAKSAPKILLVCQYGSVKSAIARELLKRRSSERHVPLTVSSRGITPEEHIPEDLRARLMAEGIDPRAQPLRKLRQSDLNAADMVILFDPLPPDLRASKARDWSAVPSMIAHYPDARADLDRRIDALLDQLVR
jgi:protein-tyrosine-phosphatase